MSAKKKGDVQTEAMDAQPVAHVDEDAIVDSSGAVFDGEIHASKDGEPVLTKAGKFRRKRRSRGESEKPPPDAESKNLGKFAAGATVQSCVILFGDEWEATQTEFNGLSNVWAQYFESKDIEDLPPGLALSIGLSAYALSRVGKPKTKSKLADMYKRAKDGVKKWKANKGNPSRSGHRDDGDGQDDAGEATVQRLRRQ